MNRIISTVVIFIGLSNLAWVRRKLGGVWFYNRRWWRLGMACRWGWEREQLDLHGGPLTTQSVERHGVRFNITARATSKSRGYRIHIYPHASPTTPLCGSPTSNRIRDPWLVCPTCLNLLNKNIYPDKVTDYDNSD